MPRSPATPCRQHGCPILVDPPGYCEHHKKAKDTEYRAERKARNDPIDKLYKLAAWVGLRTSHLRANPYCVACSTQDRLVPATMVDHIKPVRSQPDPVKAFFDRGNLQSLCNICHERKSVAEGSRFGRRQA